MICLFIISAFSGSLYNSFFNAIISLYFFRKSCNAFSCDVIIFAPLSSNASTSSPTVLLLNAAVIVFPLILAVIFAEIILPTSSKPTFILLIYCDISPSAASKATPTFSSSLFRKSSIEACCVSLSAFLNTSAPPSNTLKDCSIFLKVLAVCCPALLNSIIDAVASSISFSLSKVAFPICLIVPLSAFCTSLQLPFLS